MILQGSKVLWGWTKSASLAAGRWVIATTVQLATALKKMVIWAGAMIAQGAAVIKAWATQSAEAEVLVMVPGGKVGGAIAGAEAGAAARGGVAGFLARSLGSGALKWIMRGGIALATVDLVVKPLLQGISSGPGGRNWWDNPFGGANPSNPVKGAKPNPLSSFNSLFSIQPNSILGEARKGFNALNGLMSGWNKHLINVFDGIRHNVSHIWNMIWNFDTIGMLKTGIHNISHWFDIFRHDTANVFNGVRHEVAHVWGLIWNFDTVGAIKTGIHNIAHWLDSLRHQMSVVFDGIRHETSHIWDIIWNNTIGTAHRAYNSLVAQENRLWHSIASIFDSIRHSIANAWNIIWKNTFSVVSHGIIVVVNFFKGLPGKILGAFKGIGTTMYNTGKFILQMIWNGAKSVVPSITGFFTSFASGIVGVFKKIWGWFSPSAVMFQGGKSLMLGLANGIKAHAHLAVAQAKAAAAKTSGGMGVSATGPLQTYAKKLLAAYGWSAQWPAFADIVARESGWNVHATNPTSGAYGIPQALPAGKMASAGSDWQTSGYTQLRWMMAYIKSRWGNPINADRNELSQHWYGRGGTIPMGGTGFTGESGIEKVQVSQHGATITPMGKKSDGPVTVNVYTNEINPRYHAAMLGFELARRA
jgi:hypothetical protein